MSRPSAIVFAYHRVGVRCLEALLDADVDVRLVVSHRDSPGETIWFPSVVRLAAERDLPCIVPDDPNTQDVVAQAVAAAPDFLFSFYYRHMLQAPLLAVPRRGAYNMHGSLLPRYRGRVPINWALIHGERETGATLHVMNEKPDNGPIVDQCAVPILGNDDAREVMNKVSVAAEIVLVRSLPRLIAGTALLAPQDLSQGAYFGGRKPEDGRIPSAAGAARIHNLVRALAAPYPGAFFDAHGRRIVLQRTLVMKQAVPNPGDRFELRSQDAALWLHAADGGVLKVLEGSIDGQPLTAPALAAAFGTAGVQPDC